MSKKTNMIKKEDAIFLSKWDEHTDDHEFNYISNQHVLAHIWLKSVRKCKCKLDETGDDCRHIRQALKKLHGKLIDDMWNRNLQQRMNAANEVYGFKVPYSLQKELSA